MFNGTYWHKHTGELIPVNVAPFNQTSHEEYALENFGLSLEQAFEKGYVRIQAFENPESGYLFIDHQQQILGDAQIARLRELFAGTYKQLMIERPGEDGQQSKDFTAAEKALAYQFTISGE